MSRQPNPRNPNKDLGQLFLLTPVFPLLGAVIGYMFGRQQAGAGAGGEGGGAGGEGA
jgi:hypothetical protein